MTKHNLLTVHLPERLFYQGTHIPTKQWRRFSKGQCQIEARLDLHGHTRSEAVEAMNDFIEACQAQGKQVVLIIHGKGAVVKDIVDERLRDMHEVLAFISAMPKDGGTGAVYVMLKMRKEIV